MILTLQNFKCYSESITFNFTENKISLLKGVSGAGKSTLFKAINFVLYNKEQKVTNYNSTKKKTVVTLEFNGIVVTRTRCPNTLTLVKDGIIYNDVSAQSIINKMFGNYFSLTGYIPQKNIDSFFSLSSVEKSKFLSSIVFDEYDIDKLKQNVKQDIKSKKSQIEKIKTSYDFLQQEMSKFLPENRIEPKLNLKYTTVVDFDNKIKLKKSELTEIDSGIISAETNSQMQMKLKKQLEKFSDGVKSYNVESLKKKMEFLKSEKKIALENIKYSTLLNDIETKINKYTNDFKKFKKMYEELESIKCLNIKLDRIKEIVSIVSKFKKNFSNCLSLKSIYESNNLNIESLLKVEKEIEILKKEKKKLENDIYYLTNSLQCPHCNNSVIYTSNHTIIAVSQQIQSEDSSLSLDDMKINLNKIDVSLNMKKEYLVIIKNKIINSIDFNNYLDGEYFETSVLELEEIVNDFEKAEEYESQMNNLQIQLNQFEVEKEKLKNKLNIKCKSVSEIDIEIEKCQKLITELTKYIEIKKEYEDCVLKYKDVDNMLKELKGKKKYLISEIEELQNDKNLLIEYMFNKKEYDRYIEYEISILNLEKENLTLVKELTQLEEFYTLILNTEAETLDDVITTINMHLETFISRFFEDELTVTLVSSKSLKDGERKYEIDINIVDSDGNELSIDTLSGGEYDRCALSLFLSFNLVCKTPLILLDECLSSLNSEKVNDVIECMKEEMNGKTILMTLHQCTEGIFDEQNSVELE
jgi:ABC-type cobalamin/Fe3+-siderophores transport system ATPase subunit